MEKALNVIRHTRGITIKDPDNIFGGCHHLTRQGGHNSCIRDAPYSRLGIARFGNNVLPCSAFYNSEFTSKVAKLFAQDIWA